MRDFIEVSELLIDAYEENKNRIYLKKSSAVGSGTVVNVTRILRGGACEMTPEDFKAIGGRLRLRGALLRDVNKYLRRQGYQVVKLCNGRLVMGRDSDFSARRIVV